MPTPPSSEPPAQQFQAENRLYWSLKHAGMEDASATEISTAVQQELSDRPTKQDMKNEIDALRNDIQNWKYNLMSRVLWALLTAAIATVAGVISALITKGL